MRGLVGFRKKLNIIVNFGQNKGSNEIDVWSYSLQKATVFEINIHSEKLSERVWPKLLAQSKEDIFFSLLCAIGHGNGRSEVPTNLLKGSAQYRSTEWSN